MPPSPALLERLGRAVHDLWREAMEQDGWTYGPVYDEDAKRHDALVPFDQLELVDRKDAVDAATLDFESVIQTLSYGRGEARELVASEMYLGKRVGWSYGVNVESSTRGGCDPHDDVGTIADWKVAPGGYFLESVNVLWANGDRSEHLPATRELRRLDQEGL